VVHHRAHVLGLLVHLLRCVVLLVQQNFSECDLI
jgi:hypothetical protein